MTIKDLLKVKGSHVVTIAPEATLAEFVEGLAEHRIGAMVVSGDGSTIEGIVSERDLVRALGSGGGLRGSEWDQARVREIMTAQVLTCAPDASIDSAMAMITAERIRHVPVVFDGKLVGIVSIGDVVKARISALELERSALVDYVTTGR